MVAVVWQNWLKCTAQLDLRMRRTMFAFHLLPMVCCHSQHSKADWGSLYFGSTVVWSYISYVQLRVWFTSISALFCPQCNKIVHLECLYVYTSSNKKLIFDTTVQWTVIYYLIFCFRTERFGNTNVHIL